MEELGFAVDKAGIAEYGEIMQNKIDRLQDLVYEEVGYRFNLNSPKQLGEALFIKLGLPAGKKTKTGYSTNAEVLEKLRYEHPVVELILEYRTLAKIKSTYCDGLLKVVEEDGRIIPVLTRQKHGQAVLVQQNLTCRISLFVLMSAESCASFLLQKKAAF